MAFFFPPLDSVYIHIFLKTAHQMKKSSGSVMIRECKETETRCSLAAVHKKPKKSKCSRGQPIKGTLLCCWWECKLITATMEISKQVPY